MRRVIVQVREVWIRSVAIDVSGPDDEAIARVDAGGGVPLDGIELSHQLPIEAWTVEEIDDASLPESVRDQLNAAKGEDAPPEGARVVMRPADVRRLAKRTTDR